MTTSAVARPPADDVTYGSSITTNYIVVGRTNEWTIDGYIDRCIDRHLSSYHSFVLLYILVYLYIHLFYLAGHLCIHLSIWYEWTTTLDSGGLVKSHKQRGSTLLLACVRPDGCFCCELWRADGVCSTGGGAVRRWALEGLLHTNGHRLLLRMETSEWHLENNFHTSADQLYCKCSGIMCLCT